MLYVKNLRDNVLKNRITSKLGCQTVTATGNVCINRPCTRSKSTLIMHNVSSGGAPHIRNESSRISCITFPLPLSFACAHSSFCDKKIRAEPAEEADEFQLN